MPISALTKIHGYFCISSIAWTIVSAWAFGSLGGKIQLVSPIIMAETATLVEMQVVPQAMALARTFGNPSSNKPR